MLHGTALAGVALPDFRLPPPTSTATPQPERVGPVVPDVPQSRATPTPTPTPTGQPAVQPSPPLVVPPSATPAPTPGPRPAQSPAPTRQTPAARPEVEPSAVPVPTPTTAAPTPGATALPESLPPVEPLAPATQPEDEGGVTLLGWLAIAGLLAGGAVLLLLRRRRRQHAMEVEPEPAAPVMPDVPPVPAPAAVPMARPAPAPVVRPVAGLADMDLQVTAERLSLSVMNASLSFQLALRHAGTVPLTGVTVHGDLIGAHGALPQEEQLGGPAADAPVVARLAGVSDGKEQTVRGEVRLPLSQVTAIRQGRSSLFVPLLRLALEAEGQGRRTLTVLVGPAGQGGQVQPVRLEAGPRVIAPLLARVLG